MFFRFFLIVLILSTPEKAFADVFYSLPLNEESYRKIFKYDPINSEVAKINDLRKIAVSNEHISIEDSKAIYDKIDNAKNYVILIGHNERGHIKFPDGSSEEISKISEYIENRNLLGVFLTCNASCYTKLPGPRGKTNFDDAFLLASEIERLFQNMNPDAPPLTSPELKLSPILSPKECAAIFSITRGKLTKQSKALFSRHVSRLILKHEIGNLISATAKLTGTFAGSSILWYSLSEGE